MRSMRATVKSNSKKALRNKYGRAMVIIMLLIGINIFFMLLDAIISMVLNMPVFINMENLFTPSLIRDINLSIPLVVSNAVLALLAFFIMTPFYYGVNGWFFRMVGNENSEISSAFNYFESMKSMFKVWGAEFVVKIKKLVYFILFLFPGVAVISMGNVFQNNVKGDFDHSRYVLTEMIILLGICISIVGFICYAIYSKKYQLVQYLLTYDCELNIRKAIKYSAKISNGHKCDLFLFDLSYIFWFLICIAVIPVLYVFPYYMAGKALYSRVLIERYYLENRNLSKTECDCREIEIDDREENKN